MAESSTSSCKKPKIEYLNDLVCLDDLPKALNSGSGSCPSCGKSYSNRWKPPACHGCGFHLGGTYIAKEKSQVPEMVVRITKNIFSVRTCSRDSRCFVTISDLSRHCSVNKCKDRRSVCVNSNKVEEFRCKHLTAVESGLGLLSPEESRAQPQKKV